VKKNILVTGRPGVGKTTLILKVVDIMGDDKCGGFTTDEIREKGGRVGFKIKTLDGETGIIAHVDVESSIQLGRYKVKLDDLEDIAVEAIRKALKGDGLVVIDEIGGMELYSDKFKEVVKAALDSDKKVLASIHKRSHPFTDKVKYRPDVKLMEVTRKNRDRLPGEIFESI